MAFWLLPVDSGFCVFHGLEPGTSRRVMRYETFPAIVGKQTFNKKNTYTDIYIYMNIINIYIFHIYIYIYTCTVYIPPATLNIKPMLHKKSLPADCQSYCWTYLQSPPLSSQYAWHIKLPSSSRRGSQRPSLESHDGHDKHPSIFPWLNRSKPERFPCRPVKHDHVYMPRTLRYVYHTIRHKTRSLAYTNN